MPLDDFAKLEHNLGLELDKIDEFHEADRTHIKRFVRSLDGTVAPSTMTTYLRNIRMTGKRLGRAVCTLTEDEMDDHVWDLRRNDEYGRGEGGMADGSVRAIQHAVRKYLQFVDVDGTAWAEDYKTIQDSDSHVSPSDILTGEDIQALRDGANNLRDIALVEFLADTGARLTMAGSLRVGDLDIFDTKTPTYTPNPNATGLKGADIRPYPIIDAKAPLRNYLRQTHPRPDDPSVALFHKLSGHGNSWDEDGDGSVSKETVHDILRRTAANGGVDKPVNPHNFRHSAITRMVREGFKRPQIEARVHWTIDTSMWETYQHISGEQHNEDFFSDAGVIDTDDGPSKERKPCPNCTEIVAPHLDHCGGCGEPMTPRARQAKGQAVGSLADGMRDIADMSRREFRAEILQLLNGDARGVGGHDDSPSA